MHLLLFADVLLSFSASGRFIPWATESYTSIMPDPNQSALANNALYTLGDKKHCTNMKHNVFHSYLLTSLVSQRILLDELGCQVNWKSVVQTNTSNYRVTHVANLGSAWLWAFQLENIMPKIKLPLVFKGMEHKHKAFFSHLFNLVITWARESYLIQCEVPIRASTFIILQ